MRSILVAIVFFFVGTSLAFAQSTTTDFTIKVFAGTDDQPPTTPTLLSATPIGPSQIDISWSTATDNFILSGYVLSRSGSSSTSSVPIATTTLTTYSDVGLSASTSYTYSVRAFDSVGNYSSSSNELTATTPDIPVVVPTPTQDEGTVARVVAESVTVTPEVTSATFEVITKFQSRIEIRWGRTGDYELGYVASEALRKNYITSLTDLEPGTVYEYEIIGYTPFGMRSVVDRGQFRTLNDVDLVAPANVKRFTAVADQNDVILNWELPTDDDIAYVRIVRSHLGYPNDPLDGATVYLGSGTNGVDSDVLSNYSPAYYTAFVYDTSGNISSGAVAIVFADDSSLDSSFIGEDGQLLSEDVPSSTVSTTLQMPALEDFIIRQNNIEYSYSDTNIQLSHTEPFLIRLPVERITRNLKSIIIRIQDPTDQRQSFSFLLRLNKDKTAYEAVIAPLEVEGASILGTTVYDFESYKVAEYVTRLVFAAIETRTQSELAGERDSQLYWQFLLIVIILLLVVLWWLIARNIKEEEEESVEDKGTDSTAK